MGIPNWKRKAAFGVIKQIKKSIETNGKILDCWKYYLKTMNKNMLEIMKGIDKEFMENVLKTL